MMVARAGVLTATSFFLCVAGAAAANPAIPGRTYAPEALQGRIAGPLAPHETVKIHVLLQGRNEDELDGLIAAQSTPGSFAYGRYLTPQQFGSYFGADPATYARAIAGLRAAGLTILELPNNRRDIVAAAPAATLASLFQTPIDLHVEGSRTFYAARYAPLIPPWLHAVAVTGLDDYHEMHSHMRIAPAQIAGGQFSYAPADVAVAYDLNPLYQQGLGGNGVTMANATFGAATASDLAGFETTFKLPAAKLVTTPIDGPSCAATGCNGESTLDADWATATARNVTFDQVVAHSTRNKDFDDVYEYIVDTLGASTHVVTTSWGSCEQEMSKSELALDNGYFQQAAAEGQWWFSASGDNGTDDCENYRRRTVSVDFPGTSPYVISVGGTRLRAAIANGGVTRYESESVWAFGNCGYGGNGSNGAGGGGKSALYPKPAYQTAITPHDGSRDVPDVSLVADDVNDGLFVYDGGRLQSGWGGTSEAAPQWAGLLAIVEQKKGNYKKVADPHARLYQLAASADRAKVFHDVVGANNGVPACAGDIAVFPGYDAVKGFDLASGIGSYDGAALVRAY
ncbi:MAG TPA: S53 family peptidase [Candidatus Acidoferrales bacterium]|nr:S53 family peptidase [Candidatus Acidoferrales bacterium]